MFVPNSKLGYFLLLAPVCTIFCCMNGHVSVNETHITPALTPVSGIQDVRRRLRLISLQIYANAKTKQGGGGRILNKRGGIVLRIYLPDLITSLRLRQTCDTGIRIELNPWCLRLPVFSLRPFSSLHLSGVFNLVPRHRPELIPSLPPKQAAV